MPLIPRIMGRLPQASTMRLMPIRWRSAKRVCVTCSVLVLPQLQFAAGFPASMPVFRVLDDVAEDSLLADPDAPHLDLVSERDDWNAAFCRPWAEEMSLLRALVADHSRPCLRIRPAWVVLNNWSAWPWGFSHVRLLLSRPPASDHHPTIQRTKRRRCSVSPRHITWTLGNAIPYRDSVQLGACALCSIPKTRSVVAFAGIYLLECLCIAFDQKKKKTINRRAPATFAPRCAATACKVTAASQLVGAAPWVLASLYVPGGCASLGLMLMASSLLLTAMQQDGVVAAPNGTADTLWWFAFQVWLGLVVVGGCGLFLGKLFWQLAHGVLSRHVWHAERAPVHWRWLYAAFGLPDWRAYLKRLGILLAWVASVLAVCVLFVLVGQGVSRLVDKAAGADAAVPPWVMCALGTLSLLATLAQGSFSVAMSLSYVMRLWRALVRQSLARTHDEVCEWWGMLCVHAVLLQLCALVWTYGGLPLGTNGALRLPLELGVALLPCYALHVCVGAWIAWSAPPELMRPVRGFAWRCCVRVWISCAFLGAAGHSRRAPRPVAAHCGSAASLSFAGVRRRSGHALVQQTPRRRHWACHSPCRRPQPLEPSSFKSAALARVAPLAPIAPWLAASGSRSTKT